MAHSMRRRQTRQEIDFYFCSKERKESIPTVEELDLDSLPAGEVTCLWVSIVRNAFGARAKVPVLVAKGTKPGPVLGLTAAMHGNEVSGIPIIQKIFHDIMPYINNMAGTVLAVNCVNEWGFINSSRFYVDGADLNRCFPGKPNGTRSQQFAYHFFNKIVSKFTYLIDLHTASFGRANSFYVRADMTDSVHAKMAYLMNPQIIVHNKGVGGDGGSGTLRGAATNKGIGAICVEIGNPDVFDAELIYKAYLGVVRIVDHFGMIDVPEARGVVSKQPFVCIKSSWLYTDVGGILVVSPEVGTAVKKGEFIASVVDIFGFISAEYHAPEDGVVVGKSTNPSNTQGDRIVHFGICAPPEAFNEDGTLKPTEDFGPHAD
eukprot:comp23229_c0_seq1/m.37892 comp23229_c0_seq1/g.37892  ORF comp23229_c0_seq1/g.37892 comp23229_c0_seq1/m.37892 type:complete len:374 (-) comp23229_c0_seq1:656-1777(-)